MHNSGVPTDIQAHGNEGVEAALARVPHEHKVADEVLPQQAQELRMGSRAQGAGGGEGGCRRFAEVRSPANALSCPLPPVPPPAPSPTQTAPPRHVRTKWSGSMALTSPGSGALLIAPQVRSV